MYSHKHGKGYDLFSFAIDLDINVYVCIAFIIHWNELDRILPVYTCTCEHMSSDIYVCYIWYIPNVSGDSIMDGFNK